MTFFLTKPTQNRFCTKQPAFYSLCLLQTEALSVYICPIPHSEDYYFLLPFPLICLFIPIYFWNSLTKAGSSVKLSGSDCLVLLCKVSLHDTQFADTVPLENGLYFQAFLGSCGRGYLFFFFLNHCKRLIPGEALQAPTTNSTENTHEDRYLFWSKSFFFFFLTELKHEYPMLI